MRKGSDLFMMMSTSGTAGLPKGVPVPLRALMAFGAYMRDAVGLRSDDISGISPIRAGLMGFTMP